MVTQLSLNFGLCEIGEPGARAVAERLPAGLTQLSPNFGLCGIGDPGARAVADLILLG